jgi:hypothetical protein
MNRVPEFDINNTPQSSTKNFEGLSQMRIGKDSVLFMSWRVNGSLKIRKRVGPCDKY